MTHPPTAYATRDAATQTMPVWIAALQTKPPPANRGRWGGIDEVEELICSGLPPKKSPPTCVDGDESRCSSEEHLHGTEEMPQAITAASHAARAKVATRDPAAVCPPKAPPWYLVCPPVCPQKTPACWQLWQPPDGNSSSSTGDPSNNVPLNLWQWLGEDQSGHNGHVEEVD